MAAPNAAATNRPGKELSAAINAGSTPAAETQNQIAPLLAESGYMEKRPDGSGTQRLAKLTLAPAWSTGPGFWNCPELRLDVTVARWNDAANAGAGPTD